MITKGLYTSLVWVVIFIFLFPSCGNKSGKTEAETGEATETEEHMHEESAENEAPEKNPPAPGRPPWQWWMATTYTLIIPPPASVGG